VTLVFCYLNSPVVCRFQVCHLSSGLGNCCRLVVVSLSIVLHIHNSCLPSRRLLPIFSGSPSSVQLLYVGDLKFTRPSIYCYVPGVISPRLVLCFLPPLILILLFVGCSLVPQHILACNIILKYLTSTIFSIITKKYSTILKPLFQIIKHRFF